MKRIFGRFSMRAARVMSNLEKRFTVQCLKLLKIGHIFALKNRAHWTYAVLCPSPSFDLGTIW